jgi:putative DNA primase/helicase
VDRPSSRRRLDAAIVVGRLQGHGSANYQFRGDQDVSYYVRLLTDRGQKVLWGKDLKRAIEASSTQPRVGDIVGAQRIGREVVTITNRRRDAEGSVTSQSAHHAHRTRWRVEKVKFFADRARLARQVRDEHADAREAVRAHPELKSTFLTVRAAEEFADRRIADPRDRERFLKLVRSAMANSAKRGELLPSVQMKEKPEKAAPQKSAKPRDDEPTR